MKTSEIRVGGKYRNRGQGRTWRKVMCIAYVVSPRSWWGNGERPNEPGVLYLDDKGRIDRLYLSSFAKWAGSEVSYE